MPRRLKQNIEEEYVMDKYCDQQSKLSHILRKEMNKSMIRIDIPAGAVSGLVVGLAIGAIYGQTHAYVPEYDASGHVVEYTYSGKKFAKGMLKVVAIATLLGLAFGFCQNGIDRKRNQNWADKLSEDTFKRYFEKTLAKYDIKNPTKSNAMRAAAFIINNMPESELAELRDQAKYGITMNENGFFQISDGCINIASQMISDFVEKHPELNETISLIVDGKTPRTYFVTQKMQNTK